MNNLMLNNNITMTSLEVVDLVNKLRAEEGNNKVKEHKDFMKSIRKELEALESLGIDNGGNFSLVEYVDKKGESRPCYQLNKAGIMQMLNKESAYVRYKTQQYIEALEDRLSRPSYMIEDPVARAEKWIEEEKYRQFLLTENKELKPKADKFDNFISTDGTFGFKDLVKYLNEALNKTIKETEVREFLVKKRIIYKQGRKYVISQDGVREGYGVMRDNIIHDINRPITRYTDKLRDLLLEEFSKGE